MAKSGAKRKRSSTRRPGRTRAPRRTKPTKVPARRVQGTPAQRDLVGRTMRIIRASYDAAQTTGENRRHWANADHLSPSAAASLDVRKLIRSRARHEVANNSIAKGIVSTLATDVVGTGPRLQLTTDDPGLNDRMEMYFAQWARAVQLGCKLRTMRKAKATDGEAFAVLITNRGLESPVKLDLRLIEADRVTTPTYGMLHPDEDKAVDGIVFDADGNPAEYHILRDHPGAGGLKPFDEHDRVPASEVLHWFAQDRPEQRRGLPDIMPALPLFAMLRRWTLAMLTAAETAADMSVIMSTNQPPVEAAAEIDPWVTMELERNMLLFAPEGWDPHQMKAEHPGGQFTAFRKAIIGEIARCINMPYNVAACDSSRYNFASGRLDHETYFKSISVERDEGEARVVDRILRAWLIEAMRVPDYGMFGQIERIFWPHTWLWPGRLEVDPRWAKVHVELVRTGLETEAQHYGRLGLDWREQLRQRGREAKARTAENVPQPWERPK